MDKNLMKQIILSALEDIQNACLETIDKSSLQDLTKVEPRDLIIQATLELDAKIKESYNEKTKATGH